METLKKRRRPMAEINVVPYIDVMLVLLVIFMITAPLLNLGVEVELPKADAEPMDTQENDEPLIITVLQNGDLYLNAGGDLDGTSSGLIDPDSLVTMVTAIVSRNPEIQVLVGGDERANYGQVYNAMVLLQKAGVTKVGLMSDPMELGLGPEGETEVKVRGTRAQVEITEGKTRKGTGLRVREANHGYIRYGFLISKKCSRSFCQFILIRCWSHPASICSLNVDVPASFSK